MKALRLRLGWERAVEHDSLGRGHVGYRAGLSLAEIWERGRGVWALKPANAFDVDRILITSPEDEVLVVAPAITGLTRHGDRFALESTPLPSDPLIGQPDPLANSSRNPIAYGEI